MRKFIALHEDLELAFLSEPPEYKLRALGVAFSSSAPPCSQAQQRALPSCALQVPECDDVDLCSAHCAQHMTGHTLIPMLPPPSVNLVPPHGLRDLVTMMCGEIDAQNNFFRCHPQELCLPGNTSLSPSLALQDT